MAPKLISSYRLGKKSVFAVHFLLGDIAVTLKLKIRARYPEKNRNKWGEKLFFSRDWEWKISTQKKNISGNDNSMET